MLATRNTHKLREFARLLPGVELEPLPDDVELEPESADTYAANALLKARAAAAATGVPVIADDSGIEAEALGGAPGVRSARFAGPNATDADNLARLCAHAPAGSRLRYVCVIVHVAPDRADGRTAARQPAARVEGERRDAHVEEERPDARVAGERPDARVAGEPPAARFVERRFDGRCEGRMAPEARGSRGFGYDPVFLPDDVRDGRTMAELDDAEKDTLSHRGRAARALLAWLQAGGAR